MRVAIFDLDGTLLNTIADLGEACNYALRKAGYSEHSLDEYPYLVGNGVNKLIERSLPDGEKNEENILRLRSLFVSYYDRHNCVHTRPYAGIEELLQTLKELGLRLAVASNKYQTAAERIVKYYFGDIFDVVLGEREGCPRKPDPQIVRDIERMLLASAKAESGGGESMRIEERIYVGDSDVDIETARNAGWPMAACSWGFCSREKLLEHRAEVIIDEPIELLDIL